MLTNGEISVLLSRDKIQEEIEKNVEKLTNLRINNINGIFTPEELNNIAGMLINKGKLELEIADGILSEAELKKQKTNLTFGGFSNIEIKSENGITMITSTKKVSKTNNNQWKNIKLEGKSDMILEDELVDPYDSYQKFSKETDCITKPKPCKNCNCGRAEKDSQEAQKTADPNFKPSCGKCYLGDAFRCNGCPYRGLPAFEPGERIEFNKNTTVLNEGVLEEEKVIISVNKNNKVKLDI